MGSGSTFVLTGAGDVLGDIGSFLTGPPGDPVRIRQIAAQVEAVNAEYQSHVAALNDAVDTLTSSWTGAAASSFRSAWYGPRLCGARPTAPAQVLAAVSSEISQFAQQLCDYAYALEHTQHEHWIEMGVLAALTVVSAAQLGADPVTDAAAAGAASGIEVGASISMGALGVALQGGLINFGADVVAQLGADLWDDTDPLFNRTGDDVVPAFDVGEAAASGLSGALSFAIPGALGAMDPVADFLASPVSRALAVGAASSATDAGFQWVSSRQVNWTEAAITGGISAAAALATTPELLVEPTGSIDETGAQFSAQERNIAEVLAAEGRTVIAVPESQISGVRMYDASVDGQPNEFKTIEGPKGSVARSATVRGALQSANGQFDVASPDQVRTVILDGRSSGLTEAEAARGLSRWLGTPWERQIDVVRILGDGWELGWP